MNLMVDCLNESADAGWTGSCPFTEDRNYSHPPVVRFSFDQLWMICLCASILTGNGQAPTNKAKSEVWWSLKPVVRPPLPNGPESNAIDHFIDAELRNRGLKAVGLGDKLTL